MKNHVLHIAVAAALLILLLLLTDPFMYWMPPMAAMGVLVCAAGLLCAWAIFVMYERADDEREALHRTQAGRAAYLSGIVVLTAALLWQGLAHAIDPWIAGALAAMVVSKLLAGLYLSRFR